MSSALNASRGTDHANEGDILHGAAVTATEIRRNLAQIEFDWLAAVVERLFLILFCTLFFMASLGINGIGVYYWYFTTVDTVSHS